MDISEAAAEDIRAVIRQQLAAFQQDDAQQAFAFASPAIQAQFRTPEIFMQMVRTAYYAVYRPRSLVFENLIWVDDNLSQPVLLMDSAGEVIRALYFMEEQPDHGWRINGCFLMPLESDRASS